jgi:D-glycero-D-manno-heptose 1,7-bisphosphate phosphatase
LQKALFLDRDGIINEDYGYVGKIEDFQFKEGIFELLQNLSYPVFVITNQSGIGRGYYSLEDFQTVTDYMLKEFAKKGILIQEVYFCPHAPSENCECRKPKPKMILDAAAKYGIDLKNSIFVGDKHSDMLAAKNAGVGRKIIVKEDSDCADERVEDMKQLQRILRV